MSSRIPERANLTPEAVAAEMRALDASLDLLDEGVAQRFGLKRSELRAMELVSREGSLTAGQLARGLKITTGAVTGLIDRMERAGYFRRQDDPSDRRKVVVLLTAKAKAKERREFEQLGRSMADMVSGYRADELALLGDFLRRARTVIDQVAGSASRLES